MALFSRKIKRVQVELEYNSVALREKMAALSPHMYEYREDPGSKVFVSYLTKLLNLEILQLSSLRVGEASQFEYRQGRIDALRKILTTREQYISNEEQLTLAKDSKDKTDNKQKRSFLTKKPSSAGLSI